MLSQFLTTELFEVSQISKEHDFIQLFGCHTEERRELN